MARYALLADSTFDCVEGWKALDSVHDSLESAKTRGDELTAERGYDWIQIVDLDAAKVILRRDKDADGVPPSTYAWGKWKTDEEAPQ
jgi:hypothetical protein